MKGLFKNLKDLAECTRLYASYVITSNDNAMTIKLIKAHNDYCVFILKQQVPMVEDGLGCMSVSVVPRAASGGTKLIYYSK